MNVFYFCARSIVRHICGIMGKGKLCPLTRGRDMLRWSIPAFMLLCQVPVQSAQGAETDSIPTEARQFRAGQLAIPSALIVMGSLGVSNGWLCSVKQDVRDGFHDMRGDRRFRVDDYLQYLPVAANVGLGWTGAKVRHPLRERVAATATAYAAMGVMVNATKYSVREKRPDSNAHNSFPSGHTATAFMGAELVREEYGNGIGAGAYAFASGIAFLRLYNDRHWLNDVVAGAGVGILSARVACWLLPWERRVLGWEKGASMTVAVPAYQPGANAFSLQLTTYF